jgi:hypothetical protein
MGLHSGLEDGFVNFFAGFIHKGVFDGQFLMQDVAGDAQLTRGGIDLDAIEVKDAGGDLFEEFLGLFELFGGVGLGGGRVLSDSARGQGEEEEAGGEGAEHGAGKVTGMRTPGQ